MIREDSRGFSTAFQAPPSSRRGPAATKFRAVQATLALASIAAVAALPSSCQTGGIGDPCTPEDEYRGTFAGFQLTQENIESRSFQCESRICLVNFFQGRVSCPAGQPSKTTVSAPFDAVCSDDGDCSGDDEKCVESAVFAPDCADDDVCDDIEAGLKCDAEGFCQCSATSCPDGYVCDEDTKQCRLFVCHKPGNCQDPTQDVAANQSKDCCLPGTDTPVASEVCGQCAPEGLRNAENSVYCSCRCGSAEGAPEDENFNFCECPDGFVCAEVRPFLGLGDAQLTGKFCVKGDDPIIKDGKVDSGAAANQCGQVAGHFGGECAGQPAP
jgi:hypothetical protein